MDVIENISRWTKELNPILQGVLGSAIFALLVWLGRLLYKAINDFNTIRKLQRQRKEIIKIVFHKKFLNSRGMYYFTQGFLYVIFRAFYHLILGLIIYLVGRFLSTISNLSYFEAFGIYFAVQELLTGLSWLNTKWGYKDLSKYNPEVVDKITKDLVGKDPIKGDD